MPSYNIKGDGHKAIICLGSNVNAEWHVNEAKRRLAERYVELRSTRNVRTAPIGMKSGFFTNCMVCLCVDESLEALLLFTKQLERELGRSHDESRRGVVIIDVDVLQFDDCRLHINDWGRQYVKQLFYELNRETFAND